MKPQNNAAWALMLPAVLVMGFVAVLPLLAVLNYSFHDIFSLDQVFFVGTDWYQMIVSTPRFWASLGRSALFSALALMIQLPLGIAVALMGRNHPFGIVVASILFGFLYEGGSQLAMGTTIPREVITVLQALVILFTGALPYMVQKPLEHLFAKFGGAK